MAQREFKLNYVKSKRLPITMQDDNYITYVNIILVLYINEWCISVQLQVYLLMEGKLV